MAIEGGLCTLDDVTMSKSRYQGDNQIEPQCEGDSNHKNFENFRVIGGLTSIEISKNIKLI